MLLSAPAAVVASEHAAAASTGLLVEVLLILSTVALVIVTAWDARVSAKESHAHEEVEVEKIAEVALAVLKAQTAKEEAAKAASEAEVAAK